MNLRSLTALKRSPMAIDIYTWLYLPAELPAGIHVPPR
ncbi:MAG: hypothetical protein OXG56_13215 [Gammaproteobacteria bacterium]|nr:hypothetical protein [Gammaproteobacteria bacterium]